MMPWTAKWMQYTTGALFLLAVLCAPVAADEAAGDKYMGEMQYHMAIEEYADSLKADPDNSELTAKLARAYDKAEWYGQAVQHWEAYATKFPDGAAAAEARSRAAFCRRWLGVHFYDVGDHLDQVQDQLNKAVEWDPQYVDAYYWLGRILMERGRFQDAVAALEKAQVIDPQNKTVDWLLKETKGRLAQGDEAYSHYSEAYTLYESGNLDGALQEYQLAVLSNPEFVNAHVWIARIYMEKGQYNRALDTWRIVLQLDPGNRRAAWFRDQARDKLTGR